MDSYCTAPRCEEPTREGRAYCETHFRRVSRCKHTRRCDCLTRPIAERLTPKAKLVEVALALADADEDLEYTRLERELLSTARRIGGKAHGELVRQGQAAARRRGVHCGRPLTLTAAEARAILQQHGTVTAAAQARRVSRAAVRRALQSGTEVVVSFQRAA